MPQGGTYFGKRARARSGLGSKALDKARILSIHMRRCGHYFSALSGDGLREVLGVWRLWGAPGPGRTHNKISIKNLFYVFPFLDHFSRSSRGITRERSRNRTRRRTFFGPACAARPHA